MALVTIYQRNGAFQEKAVQAARGACPTRGQIYRSQIGPGPDFLVISLVQSFDIKGIFDLSAFAR